MFVFFSFYSHSRIVSRQEFGAAGIIIKRNDRLSALAALTRQRPCLSLWERWPGKCRVGEGHCPPLSHAFGVPALPKGEPRASLMNDPLPQHCTCGRGAQRMFVCRPEPVTHSPRAVPAKRSFTTALHLRSRGPKDVRLPPRARNAFAAGRARCFSPWHNAFVLRIGFFISTQHRRGAYEIQS